PMDVHVEIAKQGAVGIGKVSLYSPFEVLIDPSLHRDARAPDYESVRRMEARAVTPKIQLRVPEKVGFEAPAFIANEGVVVTPTSQQSMLGLLLGIGPAWRG